MDFHGDYDITGFTHDLGLTMEEVSKFYAELINEINSAIVELKLIMIKEDLANIKKIIHNIKGVSGNYRISDIYRETTKINDALKNNHYTNLEKDLNHLFDVSNIAIKEIRNFFKLRSISI